LGANHPEEIFAESLRKFGRAVSIRQDILVAFTAVYDALPNAEGKLT
jgi:hypothetical protein